SRDLVFSMFIDLTPEGQSAAASGRSSWFCECVEKIDCIGSPRSGDRRGTRYLGTPESSL
ncbi:MAG: hypothetical protein ACREQ5_22680, partial [Candidatus Dormibacteria bacterium]